MFTDILKNSTNEFYYLVYNSKIISSLKNKTLEKNKHVLYLLSLWPIYNVIESEINTRKNFLIESFKELQLNKKDVVYNELADIISYEKINENILKEINVYIYELQNGSDIQLIASQYVMYVNNLFYEENDEYIKLYFDKLNSFILEKDKNEFIDKVIYSFKNIYNVLNLI